MAIYRAQRNLALTRAGRYQIVRRGELVDPAWVREEGLARLVARGYVTMEEAEVEDAEPDIPLTRIRGIGAERAKGLASLGISTVTGLLAADPAALEQRMSSLTVRQIEDWQAQAQALVAAGTPAPVQPAVKQATGGRSCERCK